MILSPVFEPTVVMNLAAVMADYVLVIVKKYRRRVLPSSAKSRT
jgi:hypothetical protein